MSQDLEHQLQTLRQQAQHFQQALIPPYQRQINEIEQALSQINKTRINHNDVARLSQDLEQYRPQLDNKLRNYTNLLQQGKQLQPQVKTILDDWQQKTDKIHHDMQSIFSQQQTAKIQQISSQIKQLQSQINSNDFQQILQQIEPYRSHLNSEIQDSIRILQEVKSIKVKLQKILDQLRGETTQIRDEFQSVLNRINNLGRFLIQEPQKLQSILQQYRSSEQQLWQKVNKNLRLSIQANNYANEIIKSLGSASQTINSLNTQEILRDLTDLSLSHSKFTQSWQRILNEEPQLAKAFPQNVTLDFIKTLKVFEDKLETSFDQENIALIKEDDKIKNDASFEEMLKAISEDLLQLWKGALFALSSNEENPDYVRHCSVSLRELLLNIIECYAPNEDVFLWAEEKEIDGSKIVSENRPQEIIRRFKLVYIYRKYDHFTTENNSLIDFIDANISLNIKMISKLIKTFNGGTHSTTNQNTFNSAKQIIENIKDSIISILDAQLLE